MNRIIGQAELPESQTCALTLNQMMAREESLKRQPAKSVSSKVLAAFLFLTLIPCGCGRSDLPELGTVSGVLTLNGIPLSDAIVNFTPTGLGRPSTAVTDPEGKFSLIYLQGIDGAIVGEHSVTVELVTTEAMDDLPDDPSEMSEEQKQAQARAQARQLPPSATDGSIKKEVKAGDNAIDIAI